MTEGEDLRCCRRAGIRDRARLTRHAERLALRRLILARLARVTLQRVGRRCQIALWTLLAR